ncbi:methionyl-tRNA formyltransferase [Sphingomonas sp. HDW15A]|uniref:methionyl-tRNA formyltransferase n=1 Tax=Sphingomonas sp. HDW15A TaxID=2714942 RepID=UPI00140BC96E|nr:methionyl-tRNA formyltransferase [Sphingomonas sp. HDW15A]QIK96181.1 methionyl-tRNA formyltransferase [Sphingomonas sp. HDW15A]
MRIIFMGSPEFAVPSLDALVMAGHEIAAVYTQPPRPAGRGKALQPTAVEKRAREVGLDVRSPRSLRSDEEQAAFAALKADVGVVAAYGLILPQAILDAPRLGCLNVHASLLPRWRGAAPVQRAIMAGDEETGVTIMQMEAGLDTGPMRHVEKLEIGESNAAELTERLSLLGAKMMVDVLADLDSYPPVSQPEEGVTYAAKITKDEARLDWSRTATKLQRHVQGLAPFPGAWFEASGERIKLLDAESVDGAGKPGEVVGEPLVVACGEDALHCRTLQRAGKGAMPVDDFLRGFPIPQGAILK